MLPRLALAAALLAGMATSAVAQTATLSGLVVANLSPAFSPGVTQYTTPKPSNCSVPVTATLSNPAHRLYVANMETASGATRNAYACNAGDKIAIVIYQGWTEVGRYTVTLAAALPPPAPPMNNGKLAGLAVAGLMPAFSPDVTTYTIPRTTCSVPVTATLANTANRLYVSNMETASGATRSAWVCDGRTSIVINVYQVWTEVGKYTINVIGDANTPPPAPPNPPPPPPPAAEAPPVMSPAPTLNLTLPAISPVDRDTAVVFLNQATFGPTAADVAAVQANGIDRWLVQQLLKPETAIPDGLDINALRARMFQNMATGQDQLRQRVTFALSQLFVVSAAKNTNGDELTPFLQILSRHAFGNFRTLLREVTISPSMGKYLDLVNSSKAMGTTSSPNENFTREVMQLFTIGLYKLKDDGTLDLSGGNAQPTFNTSSLREIARALTGWTYPTRPGGALNVRNSNPYFVGPMEPRPAYHDFTAKTFFGTVQIPANQSVTKDMEDVVDALFNHANTPPFIATRLIRTLVTSNPSPEYIGRISAVFKNNGQGVRGDMAAVIRAVLTDADATIAGTGDGHVKDPILHVISMGRALNAQINDASTFQYIFAQLNQHMLTPVTVFSFYSPLASLPGDSTLFGPEFQIYTPALVVQRANFIYAILSGAMGSSFSIDLAPYVALAGNPSALVEQVNQSLLHGRMSPGLRAALETLTGSTSTPQQRAIGAIYLAAISSEFAVMSGGAQ